MKIARILDEADGAFGLEYDNTLGKKNQMRLYATNCEAAVREAKRFLEIGPDGRDAEGAEWDLE